MPSTMNRDKLEVHSSAEHCDVVIFRTSPNDVTSASQSIDDGINNDDLLGVVAPSVTLPPNVAPRRCRGCSEPILDRFLLQAMDSYWHTACLRCSTCGAVLGEVGTTCYTRFGLVLCRNDYIRQFGSTGTCVACRRSIPAGHYVMKVRDDVVYHVECFRCADCGIRLVPGDRFALNSDGCSVVCQRDHVQRRQLQQQQQQLLMITSCSNRTHNKIQSSVLT